MTHGARAWRQSLQVHGLGVGIREELNACFMQNRPRLDSGYLFLEPLKLLSGGIETPRHSDQKAGRGKSTSADAPREPS